MTAIAAFPYYPHGKIAAKYKRLPYVNEEQHGMHVRRVWIPSLSTKGLLNRVGIYLCFVFSYGVNLLALCKKHVDVVYYTSPYPLSFFSVPACIFGKLKGAVVMLDVADLWPEVVVEVGGVRSGTTRKILVQMARVTSTLCDYVTTITDTINEKTLELGLAPGKVQVVEMSIDTGFYSPNKSAKQRNAYPGKFIAEYSGILARKYDFETLIQAARILHAKTDDILILIRGDGERRKLVQELSYGLTNVVVLTEIVTPDVVVDFLNSADVLLCPLKDSMEAARGVPSKVLEYLSVGKPVICSGRGETVRLIESEQVGLVVPPENPAALAEAIHRLFRDSPARQRFSERARKLAEGEFSWQKTTEKIEALYAARRRTG